MGGAATKDLKEFSKVYLEQQQRPLDASDIQDLQCGKLEVVKLRQYCSRISHKSQFLTNIEGFSSFLEEIKDQINKPYDASDIQDLETSKVEIVKLRRLWLSLKLTESDFFKDISADKLLVEDKQLALSNPIISKIRQKITNEVALNYFRQHDTNGSGLIERNELRRFIRMHGEGLIYTESDLESLMNQYDLNGDGNLAYGEFLQAFSDNAALIVQSSQTLSSSVKGIKESMEPSQYFQQSDRDSSGTVDRAEMRRLLRVNGINYKEEDFDAFFALHDVSGDGKLNYEEFCRAIG